MGPQDNHRKWTTERERERALLPCVAGEIRNRWYINTEASKLINILITTETPLQALQWACSFPSQETAEQSDRWDELAESPAGCRNEPAYLRTCGLKQHNKQLGVWEDSIRHILDPTMVECSWASHCSAAFLPAPGVPFCGLPWTLISLEGAGRKSMDNLVPHFSYSYHSVSLITTIDTIKVTNTSCCRTEMLLYGVKINFTNSKKQLILKAQIAAITKI